MMKDKAKKSEQIALCDAKNESGYCALQYAAYTGVCVCRFGVPCPPSPFPSCTPSFHPTHRRPLGTDDSTPRVPVARLLPAACFLLDPPPPTLGRYPYTG